MSLYTTFVRLRGVSVLTIVLATSACTRRPAPGPAWQIDWNSATVPDVLQHIASGQDVNAEADFGETMLMQAAQATTNPAIIDVLVAHGAKVESRNRICNYTVLMEAVTKNPNVAVTEALLRHGAKVEARDEGGYTVLMLAAGRNPNPDVIEALIRKGGDVTSSIPRRFRGAGDSALGFACRANRSAATIECLIKHGADVRAGDKSGRTALFWAAAYNSLAVVGMLLEHGADVNTTDESGVTALMGAAWCNTNAVVAEFLIEHGANVNATNNNGQTALMLAVWPGIGGIKVTQCLIQHGASVNACDKYGRTPLMNAIHPFAYSIRPSPGPEMVSLLLANGADVRIRDAERKTAADRVQGSTNVVGRQIYQMLTGTNTQPRTR
jgi:ankyrin repeat protein